MTWFDKSGQRKVKAATFPDRSPEKKPIPAWIVEHGQQAASLSTWLSSRPPAPPAMPPAAVAPPPAPLPVVRPSQPPPARAAAPQPQMQQPLPPPMNPHQRLSSRPPPPFAPLGSTDALEAKALSLEQRESMIPRASVPPPLRPLPVDVLASRSPESVDLSELQAVYEAKLEAGMSAFERAIEEIAGLRTHILQQAEETIVTLAAALAKRVIGREIALDPDIMMNLAIEGTEALGERDRVLVRLAPYEQEPAWKAMEERLKKRVPRCEIVQDSRLAPGQCIVESELGRVDESVDTRLAIVLKAILPESEQGGS
jgi:vacuolar-type H+-ATPase subunit E/Vma4